VNADGHADAGRRELQRALEISQAVAAAAAEGDIEGAVRLDAERLRALEAARGTNSTLGADESQLLAQIAALNAQAIGDLLHRQRGVARNLDMLAVGQRAVRAYGATTARR
jgi:hypothetical protein